MTTATDVEVRLRKPHAKQHPLVFSDCKRIVTRAGRRSGKTTAVATRALRAFLQGRRVLYAVPTQDQITRFWFEIERALKEPIEQGLLHRDKTQRFVEREGTENRIRAKNAWDEDTLRGDYADLLILDEWQLMREDAWELAGQPMLLDNDGDALFCYTPPTLTKRARSRARDRLHAAKLYQRAEDDPNWEAYTFTSHDNPHLPRSGLKRMAEGMTDTAYRMEIMAEDIQEAPGALWRRAMFTPERIRPKPDDLVRVVIGVDPSGSRTGSAVGIIAGGIDSLGSLYVLEDATVEGASPDAWARSVVECYDTHKADRVLGERNFGGDMVESTIRTVDRTIPYGDVTASRGKAIRAEPISALYERRLDETRYHESSGSPLKVYHCGPMPELTDQMCLWTPEIGWSPDRIDALVIAATELMGRPKWSPVIA